MFLQRKHIVFILFFSLSTGLLFSFQNCSPSFIKLATPLNSKAVDFSDELNHLDQDIVKTKWDIQSQENLKMFNGHLKTDRKLAAATSENGNEIEMDEAQISYKNEPQIKLIKKKTKKKTKL